MWSTLWTCKICLSNPIEVYRNRYIQFIQIIFWLRYIGPGMAVKWKRMKRKAGQKFLILAHKTDNISSKYRWCQELDKQSNFDEVEQIIELLCDLLELSSHMIVSISLPLTTLLLSWGGRSRDEHEMYTLVFWLNFTLENVLDSAIFYFCVHEAGCCRCCCCFYFGAFSFYLR